VNELVVQWLPIGNRTVRQTNLVNDEFDRFLKNNLSVFLALSAFLFSIVKNQTSNSLRNVGGDRRNFTYLVFKWRRMDKP